MTYEAFIHPGDTVSVISFVYSTTSNEMLLELSVDGDSPQWPQWVRDGLNYTGAPGGLGEWSTHRSDLKAGTWAVRDPLGRVIGYTKSQSMADAIVAAMTDYPNPEPGI